MIETHKVSTHARIYKNMDLITATARFKNGRLQTRDEDIMLPQSKHQRPTSREQHKPIPAFTPNKTVESRRPAVEHQMPPHCLNFNDAFILECFGPLCSAQPPTDEAKSEEISLGDWLSDDDENAKSDHRVQEHQQETAVSAEPNAAQQRTTGPEPLLEKKCTALPSVAKRRPKKRRNAPAQDAKKIHVDEIDVDDLATSDDEIVEIFSQPNIVSRHVHRSTFEQCTMHTATLWPGADPLSFDDIADLLENLDVAGMWVSCRSDKASVMLPDFAQIKALTPRAAVAAEIYNLIFPVLATIYNDPKIVSAENGEITWDSVPEICLEESIAAMLSHDDLALPVGLARQRVAGPVNALAGKSAPYCMFGKRVILTLGYRKAQFQAIVDTRKPTEIPVDPNAFENGLTVAFRAFVARPDWFMNLRREKALGAYIASGNASALDIAVSFLTRPPMNMRTTIATTVNVPSSAYHAFFRSAEFISKLLLTTGVKTRGCKTGMVSAATATKCLTLSLHSWSGSKTELKKRGKQWTMTVANAWIAEWVFDLLC